jgi:hypothetical protein
MSAASQWKRRTCTHWQAASSLASPLASLPAYACGLSMEEENLLFWVRIGRWPLLHSLDGNPTRVIVKVNL